LKHAGGIAANVVKGGWYAAIGRERPYIRKAKTRSRYLVKTIWRRNG
jgi:hypothetical protein